LASGCITESMRRTEVANRSSLDFRCPESAIRVVRIGEDGYYAAGCGKHAQYWLQQCSRHFVPAACWAMRVTRVQRRPPGTPLPRRYKPSKRKSPLDDQPAISRRGP
jgi:hypothetical protein